MLQDAEIRTGFDEMLKGSKTNTHQERADGYFSSLRPIYFPELLSDFSWKLRGSGASTSDPISSLIVMKDSRGSSFRGKRKQKAPWCMHALPVLVKKYVNSVCIVSVFKCIFVCM